MELTMLNRLQKNKLKTSVLTDDYVTLFEFTPAQILAYSDINYPTVLLLAMSEASNEMIIRIIDVVVVNLFGDKKAEFLNKVDQANRHALTIAAKNDKVEILPYLLNLEFNLDSQDQRGHRALYYLNKNKHYDQFFHLLRQTDTLVKEEAKLLSENLRSFPFSTKIAKEKIGNDLTLAPAHTKQTRLLKTFKKPEVRTYRSFAHERERQLLRQVSTQLYLGLNEKLKEKEFNPLVEVQIMHLQIGNKNNLFIAVNENENSAHLKNLIQDDKNFHQLLTTPHPAIKKEGALRSERYAAKLSARLFNPNNQLDAKNVEDLNRYQQVIALLKKGKLQEIAISYGKHCILSDESKQTLKNKFSQKNHYIYLLYIEQIPAFAKARHAEEFLTDIADEAKAFTDTLGVNFYSCIGGKKRPCIGCYGRMTGHITQFGQFPGGFWTQTLKHQTNEAAINTIRTLLSKKSYISATKNGKGTVADFDSGSDSEGPEHKNVNRVDR